MNRWEFVSDIDLLKLSCILIDFRHFITQVTVNVVSMRTLLTALHVHLYVIPMVL